MEESFGSRKRAESSWKEVGRKKESQEKFVAQDSLI
tara:strand:- start:1200 stop:1307 length:108 start_codon:yes stop_codon:yes gene_type:complete